MRVGPDVNNSINSEKKKKTCVIKVNLLKMNISGSECETCRDETRVADMVLMAKNYRGTSF